ncbi:ABC transporter ATP-binding protein [candidate division TA06 bacterium]|nr:ABC transporter ATP-binding protein [candidate division TA06 bacterium]
MDKNSLKTIFRFLSYLRPYWKKGLFAFMLMLLTAALQLPMPFITGYLIDKVIPSRSYDLLNIIGWATIGVIVIRVASYFFQTYLLTTFKARVIFDIRRSLFVHVLKAPVSFFHGRETGYLMSRLSGDVDSVQGLLADAMVTGFQNVLLFLGGTIAVLYIHSKLALFSLALLPFYLLSLIVFNKRIRSLSAQNRELAAAVQQELQELLSGVTLVKAYTAENRAGLKYISVIKAAIKNEVKLDMVSMGAGLTSMVISNISPLALLWYGSAEIMRGNLTVGGLLAFVNFIGYLFGPVRVLYDLNLGIQRSLPAVERIFEILSVSRENYRGPRLKIVKGSVCFEGVGFSYGKRAGSPEMEDPEIILKDLDLRIEPGQTVALVGRSGAGKTTLMSLLLRLYEPTAGRILVDGQDIAGVSLTSLRQEIGWVSQDTFLFSGTVMENIRFGRPQAADREVMEAARQASAHGFIENLSQGYQTKVGERGCTLSGGQRQRIAIARALLKDPKILIMDEATSQIDSQSERDIRQTLNDLGHNRAVIIIAHRLSTVREADMTVVLDQGRIIARGRHEDLYESCPLYRELYSKMETA